MTVASAPDSEALDKEAPLRRDIRLLGRILGDTIRSQEGHSVFELVEIVRKTAMGTCCPISSILWAIS